MNVYKIKIIRNGDFKKRRMYLMKDNNVVLIEHFSENALQTLIRAQGFDSLGIIDACFFDNCEYEITSFEYDRIKSYKDSGHSGKKLRNMMMRVIHNEVKTQIQQYEYYDELFNDLNYL